MSPEELITVSDALATEWPTLAPLSPRSLQSASLGS
jgi:hypothetical protein